MKYLFLLSLILSSYLFAKDNALPPIEKGELSRQFDMAHYFDEQSLAPPVTIIENITVEDAEGNEHMYEVSSFKQGSMIHEIRSDRERPEPLIIKVKKTIYLILFQSKITIREIVNGGETLFDQFFNIKPPTIPPPGDTNDWKPDDDKPNRWDWKP